MAGIRENASHFNALFMLQLPSAGLVPPIWQYFCHSWYREILNGFAIDLRYLLRPAPP
jgi:hypothetical protein